MNVRAVRRFQFGSMRIRGGLVNSKQAEMIYNVLLDAPCNFCGYNGPGYFQAGTHYLQCVWYSVGGYSERIDYFVRLIKENRILFHK